MKSTMPGEDQMIKGQQELTAGLKDIFAVLNNWLTTVEVNIEPGNTLWNIAEKQLGNGQRWREIYIMNLDRIWNAQDKHHGTQGPDMIYSGNTIRILAI